MIDLTRSVLLIQSVPEPWVDYRTMSYFLTKGMPLTNIMVNNTNKSVVESRNSAIRDMLGRAASGKYDWFVFMDRDHWPTKDTDEFLNEIEGYDVIGAAYDVGSKRTWANPDAIHMGTVRVRAEVLTTIQPPWFAFRCSDDGTDITMCECDYFKRKCQDAGYKVTRRGWTEHDSKHTWKTHH